MTRGHYITVDEDVVFLYGSTLTFFEHQSTWSPNLPYRMLEYAAKQMSVMTEKSELSIYSGTMMKLPKPKFYVLYNGNDKNVPPQSTLRLSQCYDTKIRIDDLGNSYDLEVIVHVFNFNYGCNQTVQEKCRVLEEYTWIVSSIRKETESGRSLNDAINHSIEMIPEDFVIHNVILAERGRVAAMLFDEMGDARQIEKLRYELRDKFVKEGIEKGIEQGIEQGINETKAKVTRAMILEGCDDSFILKIADVTPEYLKTIRDDSANE